MCGKREKQQQQQKQKVARARAGEKAKRKSQYCVSLLKPKTLEIIMFRLNNFLVSL